MASIEINGPIKTFQDTFFSKSNISLLNKKILEKNNLGDIPKEAKSQIINLLIKNMKTIYKAIDLKKINNKNFESIFQQFNNTCFNETNKELQKKDIMSLITPNSSELKFKRDFDSNPNNGNKLMDRPIATSEKFLYPPGFDHHKTNIPDNKFDNLFKPIVDNIDENYAFNKYQHGKGQEETIERLTSLQSERDHEVYIPGKNRPPTPDFLKPIETNPNRKPAENQIRSSNKDQFSNTDNGQVQEFKSLNEDDGDLYNINNIDKGINLREIEVDNRPFSERLKNLQSDRGNVRIENKGKINFTGNDFTDTFNQRDKELEEIPDYKPKTIEEIRQEKENEMINKRLAINKSVQNERYNNQQNERYNNEQNERYNNQQNERYNNQQNERYNNEQISKKVHFEERKPQNEISITKLLASKKNIDIEKIQTTLKKLGMVEYSEVEHIYNENKYLKSQLQTNSTTEINKVKQDLFIEYEKLTEKDKLLTEKEEEIKKLIKQYNYVYSTSNIQLNIDSVESINNYSFNSINNITGIKLVSYSIPQARFNIEEDKNNIFRIKKNNELIELKLLSGKYTIDILLNELNKQNEEFNFILTFDEKIKITSNDCFDIINTPLSKEVLGFINTYISKNNYISDRIWDLRIEDKAFLFLNNINDAPFAVLYPNNNTDYHFKFEDPITLENLELVFKDSKGRLFNFYGLNYNINIQLEILDSDL